MITKRKKFVISSLLLSIGFIVINTVDIKSRFLGIGILALMTIVLFIWSLWEGLGLNMTLLVLILPLYFTLGVGFFWFLLPSAVYTWLPVVIIYGIGTYSLLLTLNIFTVSAIRTIALSRAARSVGFVLTLFTSFLLFDAVLSLKSSVYINFIAFFIISFPLFLQGLWSSLLTKQFNKNILYFSLVFSYCVSVLSVLLYFWPVTLIVGSIFLTSMIYVLLGLGQIELENRLFISTLREYLFVGISIFLVMFLFTNWRL